MALRVGITGGIGSGKSTVARVFEVLGIPVYNADAAAKRLMNEDPVIRQSLMEAFGPETYSDNQLNRAFLAGVVFNNPAKLEILNQITHPATIHDSQEWTARQKKSLYDQRSRPYFRKWVCRKS
ncbi:MAG: dephospho-CoA kinase [Chitinophagaceae bacterium]|nr:dephospho-CoA kinase [Chitinophagaceae bacterium]